MKELKIDQELKELLPPLTDEEYKQLEKNIVTNGFDNNFPIMEWHGYIVDGHNRYNICHKHNIEYSVGTLAYETKDEVVEWMLDVQLGRRNLSPMQKIAITEKYRPIYEKQAKENKQIAIQKANIDNSKHNVDDSILVNLPKTNPINTSEKLSKIAGVSEKTYRMGAKILNSDNEELKKEVMNGKKSINAGYKELTKKDTKLDNQLVTKPEAVKTTLPSDVPVIKTNTTSKSEVSDRVKQVCAEVKTEKTKEYIESNFDYSIDIIHCMNSTFERYFGGFISTLHEMSGRVTEEERTECIENAEYIVKQMNDVIDEVRNCELKSE